MQTQVEKSLLELVGVLLQADTDGLLSKGLLGGGHRDDYARALRRAIAGLGANAALKLREQFGVEVPFDLLDSKEPAAQVAHSETLATDQVDTLALRLVLDVTYTPNGVAPAELSERLQAMCEHAIGEGMLTGATMAEVDQRSLKIIPKPVVPAEADLVAFMQQRIESGNLDAQDIPLRLVRYGLMESHDFASEMHERMELAKEES
ncbi:hypothetical protein [Duganella vulcania]|nr:hypothetical protein [Duganella vulcania]